MFLVARTGTEARITSVICPSSDDQYLNNARPHWIKSRQTDELVSLAPRPGRQLHSQEAPQSYAKLCGSDLEGQNNPYLNCKCFLTVKSILIGLLFSALDLVVPHFERFKCIRPKGCYHRYVRGVAALCN